jgi:GT2 family glycosyltransferase
MMADSLDYSVVIATYHRHSVLSDTLRALVEFVDPLAAEVIVVDQCPRDSLPSDVLARPQLRYVTLDRPGMVAARNVGLARACGRVVLFLDDDVIPTPELIPAHLGAYADLGVGGVAGRILRPGQTVAPPPHPKVFDPADGWRHAHFDHTVPGNVMTARGCNMSFRRDVLMELGGFDPYIAIFRDDSDMCLRVIAAGYKVRFVPAASLVHLDAPSGGTRGGHAAATGCLGREIRMYWQQHRHYRDNLYFIVKHFRGAKRLTWLADAYRTYVGLSRWPWRLAAKNACFLVALLQASWLARFRRNHPCALTG